MPVKKIQKNKTKNDTDKILNKQIYAVLIIAAAVFVLVGTHWTDQTGLAGYIINRILRTAFGEAALVVPVLLAIMAFCWLKKVNNYPYRILGLAIIFLVLLTLLHLRLVLPMLPGEVDGEHYRLMMRQGIQQDGGGMIGALFAITLFFFFRDLGSYIIISALVAVAILLLTNYTLSEIGVVVAKHARFFFNAITILRRCIFTRSGYFFSRSKVDGKETQNDELCSDLVHHDHNLVSAVQPLRETPCSDARKVALKQSETICSPTDSEKTTVHSTKAYPMLNVSDVPMDDHGTSNHKEDGTEDDLTQNDVITSQGCPEKYSFPPLKLLTQAVKMRDLQQLKAVRERARALENTFASFGVKVKIKEIQTGPTVTRYEIQPESGVKVSRILSLSNDLALSMAAPHVRIEAPIPGKAAVGVEVPNEIVSLVYIRDVLEDSRFQESPSPLHVALGKDIAGNAVFADLLKMPHLLIAGSTGSGKSVCINALICSILYKADPWIVKFLLIDPKMVELNIYNGIPHLILPVVTDAKKAAAALRSMVREMERRYDLFARHGVREIGRFNEISQGNTLPYILVVIDELSDLMMVAPSEVEDSIVRLSQMSRAAGIHLVIATQRPSVDVITGLIKANITSRIAFAVSSQTDSRTILDIGGAEKLMGGGDMLYHPLGIHKPLRIQGAFVSEGDVFRVVDFIRQQGSISYQQSFINDEESDDDIPVKERDELLPEVLDLIMHAGHASISLIQRRFRIGYTRAARIIDNLELLGIIGKFEGSKPRQLLISREQAKTIIAEKNDQI